MFDWTKIDLNKIFENIGSMLVKIGYIIGKSLANLPWYVKWTFIIIFCIIALMILIWLYNNRDAWRHVHA